MDEAKIGKLFPCSGESVLVRRHAREVILEPLDGWPEDDVESFTGMPEDFVRPDQGHGEVREPLF